MGFLFSLLKKIKKITLCKTINEVSVFSSRNDIKVIPFSKSEEFIMPQLNDIFGNSYDEFNSYKANVPDYYVFEIDNGQCIVGREEVYTKDNKVVSEITSQKNNPITGSSLKRFRKIISIDGTVANMSLSGLENNYYHFLVEFSARLFMLKELNINPDYYIYPMNTAFQKEFLSNFNIDSRKLISLDEGTWIQAKKIIAPALINNWNFVQYRDVVHFKKQFLPSWIDRVYKDFRAHTLGNKRIYISRKLAKFRKVINEDIIIDFLKQKNFEIHYLENYTVQQQIELFNKCSVLIAPHGAGLINMCYSAPGIKILELFPKYYHDNSFMLQSVMLKNNYNYLICDTENTAVHPQQEDIIINEQTFIRAVNLLLEK
ncbi:MAG: glycosyltransferase family 61 protein [Spirochaetales bacterium]|nr:glycosyltransferase family 61 protein [Spirochaetales bacterium]